MTTWQQFQNKVPSYYSLYLRTIFGFFPFVKKPVSYEWELRKYVDTHHVSQNKRLPYKNFMEINDILQKAPAAKTAEFLFERRMRVEKNHKKISN